MDRAGTDVIIVGAGFAGLVMGLELARAGIGFRILEKADRLGGTWRDNTYPGAAADTPSHLYAIADAPNPDWSRTFAEQPEILAYLEGVAARRGLLAHIRFGREMQRAVWDEATRRWRVTAGGQEILARTIVLGVGGLHIPHVPALAGIERFSGARFHSAAWDHGLDLAGKRVVVIGTGASAVQFVPRIAPEAAELTIYQRTAPWIVPKSNRPIPAWLRRIYRGLPVTRALRRAGSYWLHELSHRAFAGDELALRLFEHVARRHLRAQVPDAALRARLTPDYRIGCKRILLSDDYYPALGRGNVRLVTDAIGEVETDALRTADGTRRPAEVIIYGTGFRATDAFRHLDIRGRSGRALRDAWASGMHAAYGTCTAGFPNMFVLLGPNTALGHNSVILMIEAQARFIAARLADMRRTGIAAIDVTAAAERDYVAEIDRRLAAAVWSSGGCHSWYIDPSGRNTTLWPGTVREFRERLARAGLEGFATT